MPKGRLLFSVALITLAFFLFSGTPAISQEIKAMPQAGSFLDSTWSSGLVLGSKLLASYHRRSWFIWLLPSPTLTLTPTPTPVSTPSPTPTPTPTLVSGTIDVSVTASFNDATDNYGTGQRSDAYPLITHKDANGIRSSGVRFQNITIPRGSTITSAYIEAYIHSGSFDYIDMNIYGEAADNSADFSPANPFVSARAKTAAFVSWTASSAGMGYKRSPDISSVIQGIVQRTGWQSGNSLSVLMFGRSAVSKLEACSYDNSRLTIGVCVNNSPKLHITYSSGAGLAPLPTPTPISVPGASALPFNVNSIWNKQIPFNPTILSEYSVAITELAKCGTAILGVDWGGFSNLYLAGSTTPKHRVTRNGITADIPVPEPVYADPADQGNDRKIVIDDLSTNKSYGFWRWTNNGNGTYTADTGGWSDMSSLGDGLRSCWNGIEVWGGRAAGWPYRGGFPTLAEMKAALPSNGGPGYLNHALAIALPVGLIQGGAPKYPVNYPRVWPARSTDGHSQNSNFFLMGQRLQLDPNLNLDTLNLSPGAKVLAKTLQRYGGWISDSGSGGEGGSCTTSPGDLKLQVQEVLRCDSSRGCIDSSVWSGILGVNDFDRIPRDRFRVIQVNQGDFYVGGSCGG